MLGLQGRGTQNAMQPRLQASHATYTLHQSWPCSHLPRGVNYASYLEPQLYLGKRLCEGTHQLGLHDGVCLPHSTYFACVHTYYISGRRFAFQALTTQCAEHPHACFLYDPPLPCSDHRSSTPCHSQILSPTFAVLRSYTTHLAMLIT